MTSNTAQKPRPAAARAPISPTSSQNPNQKPGMAEPGMQLTVAQMASGTVTQAIPGQPSSGPTEAPDGPGPTPTPNPAPGPSPSPSPQPGGTGSGGSGGSQTPAPIPGGDAFATSASAAFFDLIRNASSPDALEAQNIILRRIALEGDVVNSRVPAPRNISEIGGYLNLLTDLNEIEMRSQVLAGILGVSGPNPQLGWTAPATALGFRAIINDRPTGPAQAGLPVTVMVRTDFYDPLQAALAALHDRGCMLPLLSGPLSLPVAGGSVSQPPDPLDYIGRVLRVAPSQALANPATDTLALIRKTGTTDPYALAARSTGGTVAVPAADYDALQLTGQTISSTTISAASMVMIGPILAVAGYSLAGAVPIVGGPTNDSWSRLMNVAGLQAGQTLLGDELALLHSRSEISASAFAGMQKWRWTGTVFAP